MNVGLTGAIGTSRQIKRSSPMQRESEGEVDFSAVELAEDRTLLASERTFAGWVRTSLGCIAVGLGFHALFSALQPAWVPRAIANLFLLLAAVIVWLATGRAAAVVCRLSPHVVVSARRMNLTLIASAISLGAAALAIAVWALPTA